MTISNLNASTDKKVWSAPAIDQFRVEDITHAANQGGNDGNGVSTLS